MGKNIGKSVGAGGANKLEDVRVVQYLLNCVPVGSGGPQKELVIDGIAGPLTRSAINGFQSKKLGFCDGRVDPGGRTITALQVFDPYPNQDLAPAPAAKSASGGANGGSGKQTGGYGGSGKDTGGYGGSGKQTGSYGGSAKQTGGYGGYGAGGSLKDTGGYGSGGKMDGGSSGSGKGGSTAANDPWGYYNPASPYYMKAGYEPSSGGIKSGSGKADGGWDGYGGKSTGNSSNDPWGYYNPASPYYMKAGYEPGNWYGTKSGSDGGGKSA